MKHVFPLRTRNVLVCEGSDDASYLVGLAYPCLLIAVCTVYAFKTRKCPEGFNEARHLAFANYTTCVIWLAFLPLFVLSGSTTVRALSLSFLLSLSGAVLLACLFAPKIYIALCKPDKNTRQGVMCRGPPAGYHSELRLNNLSKSAEAETASSGSAANIYLMVPGTGSSPGAEAPSAAAVRPPALVQSKTL